MDIIWHISDHDGIFLFFSEQMGRVPRDTYQYNLHPFAEIKRYLYYAGRVGTVLVLLNLLGNIICFNSIWICNTGTVCAMQQFWQDPSAKFFGIITGREYTISVQVRIV